RGEELPGAGEHVHPGADGSKRIPILTGRSEWLEQGSRHEEIEESDETLPSGGGEKRKPNDCGYLILVAGTDRLADEDRPGAGDAEGRHERHGVDLEDRHHTGERRRAEAGDDDVHEEAERRELEEPAEAGGKSVAEHAAELGRVE